MIRLVRICAKAFIGALLVGVFAIISGCDSPTAFERKNVRDPKSDHFAPESPDALTAMPDGQKVVLSWKDQSNFEDGYLIERSIDDAEEFIEIARLGRDETQFRELYPKPAFKLTYRVSAFRDAGDQLQLEAGDMVDVVLYPDATRRPELKLVSETRMDIVWKDFLDFESGYELQRASGRGPFETIGLFDADQTAASDEMLFHPEVTYRYRVRAVYEGGATPFTDIAERHVWQSDYSTPSPNVHVDEDAETVIIRWNGISMASAYFVERAEGDDGAFVTLAELPPEARSYRDETINRSVAKYSYRVRTILSHPSFPVRIRYGRGLRKTQALKTSFLSNRHARFVPNGKKLITAGYLVHVWDLERNTVERTISVGGIVYSTAVHPWKPWIAFAHSQDGDSRLTVLDYETGSVVHSRYLEAAQISVRSLAFSPDGSSFVLASERGVIEKLDALSWTSRWRIQPRGEVGARDLAFSPDGSTLIAVLDEHGLAVDPSSGQVVNELSGFRSRAAFSADGRYLAGDGRIGSGDGVVYDLIEGEEVWSGMSNGFISNIGFMGDQDVLYMLRSNTFEVWDVESRSKLYYQYLEYETVQVGVSSDGRTLAVVHADDQVGIWNDEYFWAVLH